jgi:hypothetical protein
MRKQNCKHIIKPKKVSIIKNSCLLEMYNILGHEISFLYFLLDGLVDLLVLNIE